MAFCIPGSRLHFWLAVCVTGDPILPTVQWSRFDLLYQQSPSAQPLTTMQSSIHLILTIAFHRLAKSEARLHTIMDAYLDLDLELAKIPHDPSSF